MSEQIHITLRNAASLDTSKDDRITRRYLPNRIQCSQDLQWYCREIGI